MKFSIIVFFCFITSSVSLFGQSTEKPESQYIFGYDAKIIQEVGGSFNSIKIALDTFAKKINSGFGLKWFKTSDELITALDENKITCASIMPLTYLFSDKKNVKPLIGAIPTFSEDAFVRYIVIVRSDSGIDKLEQLENATIAKYKGEEVGGLYMNTELAKRKLKFSKEFFGKPAMYESQEESFYSVYFKKNKTCLISEDTLNMLIDMNPSIKDQVKILLKSEKFIVGGLFVTKSITKELEQDLIKTSMSLHLTVPGKQTLRLVRSKRLCITTDADFDSIRQLLKEFKEITKIDYKELYEKSQVNTD